MKNLGVLCALCLLFIGCGDVDDDPRAECDPELFDCTPVVPAPNPNPDDCEEGQSGDCSIEEPVSSISQDEMRAAGIVFPGDSGFTGPSITANNGPRDDQTELNAFRDALYAFSGTSYGLWDEWLSAKWSACIIPMYPRLVCHNHARYTSSGGDWRWREEWDEETMRSGTFCLLEEPHWANSNAELPDGQTLAARLYEWNSATGMTLYGPPDFEQDWVCVETPYGAGFLVAPGAHTYWPDKTFSVNDGRLDTTCHPEIEWMAFTQSNTKRIVVGEELVYEAPPNAYTVDTRFDGYHAVSNCVHRP